MPEVHEGGVTVPEKSLHDLDRRNRVAETLRRSRHAFNVYTEALVTSGEMTSAHLRPMRGSLSEVVASAAVATGGVAAISAIHSRP